MNKYPVKQYPVVGVCGLDCGLCPRYHTDGKSKCPGCCGPDFFNKHPSCGFITCCVRQKNLETCGQCIEWQECVKYAQLMQSAQIRDSFISYKPVAANFAFIRKYGVAEFARQETEKQKVLCYLLDNYDDGRSKIFYCTACQLLPLAELNEAMKNAEKRMNLSAEPKEKAKLMRSSINRLADSLQIDLKLRK